jgi:hypothetical protein
MMLIANGHVYGLREEGAKRGEIGRAQGVCEVYTLDGKKVASNVLLAKERTESELNEKWLGQGFRPGSFSYGCLLNIGGDRIYIRSEDYLYCIGAKWSGPLAGKEVEDGRTAHNVFPVDGRAGAPMRMVLLHCRFGRGRRCTLPTALQLARDRRDGCVPGQRPGDGLLRLPEGDGR